MLHTEKTVTKKRSNRFYTNTKDINELQHQIMVFVGFWVHTEKTPVPHRAIIVKMQEQSVKDFTTVNAIAALLRKGYLRKAVTMSNRDRSYVQLRTV